MDRQTAAPGGNGRLVGVAALCVLIAASVVLLVITQRNQTPAASLRVAAPFPAPCTDGGDTYHCYAMRIDNVGDLAGSVVCTVADTADGAASFVNGDHDYRSAPIEPGGEAFVIVQVRSSDVIDPGTAPAPEARCSAAPPA